MAKAPAKSTLVEQQETALEAAAAPAPTQVHPIAVQGSRAVALPAGLAEELANEAKDEAAKERPSVSKLSLRGGQLTYMGNILPEKKIDVILIGVGYWNKFYEGAFNPNVTVNPTCFAVQTGNDDDMVPHENVEEPQHENCHDCPRFQWKSDLRGGKGKACKETRRLGLIVASSLESAEAVSKAEFAVVDLPPTSIKNYANFVNALAASVKRPMWSVITTLEVRPHPKNQFEVVLTPISTIDDADLLNAIRARKEEAERACTIPYDEAYLQGEIADKDAKNVSETSGRGASKFKA